MCLYFKFILYVPLCGLMGALQVDNPSFLLNYAYMRGGISISMEC